MHRDVVTHVAVSAAEFFITGSVDGKFFHVLKLLLRSVPFTVRVICYFRIFSMVCYSNRLFGNFDLEWFTDVLWDKFQTFWKSFLVSTLCADVEWDNYTSNIMVVHM